MADFIVGSPVRDEDFMFREYVLDDIWESIEKHNVLLLAPRRIGKTSVMYRMLDYPKDDWLVIHLNVEDLKTPSEFFITLIDAINEHQPDFLRNTLMASWDFLKGIFDRIESIEAYELKVALRKSEDLKESWQERASELMDKVLGSKQRVLFIIDELPDMINGIFNDSPETCETFLHWFRKLREKSLSSDLRWLVGGSVNLIAALDQQGKIKLINDLKVEPLLSFTEEEVKRFVNDMLSSREVKYADDVAPRIWELLGAPIPFFLQMLTQELYRRWKRDRSEIITADTVTEVFNKSLLGEMARDKLQHYRTRINVHYPQEEQEAACLILSKLSLSTEGISKKMLFDIYRQIEEEKSDRRTGTELSQAFQRLLLYLQSDFYIEDMGNSKFDFASRLIKTWWKKYYGYEYGDN